MENIMNGVTIPGILLILLGIAGLVFGGVSRRRFQSYP